MRKMGVKLEHLDTIRLLLEDKGKKDDAALIIRSLLESSISECVVAFQRYCDEVFKRKFPSVKIPFNLFQKINEGSDMWRKQISEGYDYWLTVIELEELRVIFQKRHLLAHCEGIVDTKYVQNTSDNNYIVGQRLVIKENDVRNLTSLLSKIASNITKRI